MPNQPDRSVGLTRTLGNESTLTKSPGRLTSFAITIGISFPGSSVGRVVQVGRRPLSDSRPSEGFSGGSEGPFLVGSCHPEVVPLLLFCIPLHDSILGFTRAHYFADPGAWPHCGRDARLAVPPKKQARPNR
jgi:hypothetical protein